MLASSPIVLDSVVTIDSMCGTLPGSTSTTCTLYGAHIVRVQLITCAHAVAEMLYAGIAVVWLTRVDRLVRESLLPGLSVTPFLLM
jgi:hypothetical protein